MPTHVGGIEHLGKSGHEILVDGAEAGVDDHRLLGMKDIGVNGKEAESGNLGVVVEDCDIADPVNLHGVISLRQERGW